MEKTYIIASTWKGLELTIRTFNTRLSCNRYLSELVGDEYDRPEPTDCPEVFVGAYHEWCRVNHDHDHVVDIEIIGDLYDETEPITNPIKEKVDADKLLAAFIKQANVVALEMRGLSLIWGSNYEELSDVEEDYPFNDDFQQIVANVSDWVANMNRLKEYEYSIPTSGMWSSIDHGIVMAKSIREARNKAIAKVSSDLETLNNALEHSDNCNGMSVDMDADEIDVKHKRW